MKYQEYLDKLPTSGAVYKRPTGWAYKNPTGERSGGYKTKSEATKARNRWTPCQSQLVSLGLLTKGDILTFQKWRSESKEDVTVLGVEHGSLLVKHMGKEKTLPQVQRDLGGGATTVNFKSFKVDKFGGVTLHQLRRDVSSHCASKEPSSREQLILDLTETNTQEVSEDAGNLALLENNTDNVSESENEKIFTFVSSCLNLLGDEMSELDRYHQIGKSLVELTSKTIVDN